MHSLSRQSWYDQIQIRDFLVDGLDCVREFLQLLLPLFLSLWSHGVGATLGPTSAKTFLYVLNRLANLFIEGYPLWSKPSIA